MLIQNDAARQQFPKSGNQLAPTVHGLIWGVPTIIEPLVKHLCQGYAGINRESCGQKMSESATKSINGTVESDYDQLLSN